ncbi:hypothetical protein [Rhodococcus qingshengii]
MPVEISNGFLPVPFPYRGHPRRKNVECFMILGPRSHGSIVRSVESDLLSVPIGEYSIFRMEVFARFLIGQELSTELRHPNSNLQPVVGNHPREHAQMLICDDLRSRESRIRKQPSRHNITQRLA